MEKGNVIKPINQNVEIEENPSFAQPEKRAEVPKHYPIETRSTINLENAIYEQTREIKKINSKISWIIFLLSLPYVVGIVIFVVTFLLGVSIQQSSKTSVPTRTQSSNTIFSN